MGTQPTLFDSPPPTLEPPPPPNVQPPATGPGPPLRQKAVAWMEANPHVYRMFEQFALTMARKRQRFGINLLRERVRWECHYHYGEESFKFCNSYSPYVARQLIADHPKLADYMICRRTKDELETIA